LWDFIDNSRAISVCFPFIEKLLGIFIVYFKAFRLPIRSTGPSNIWAFVPIEAEPFHSSHNSIFILFRGTFSVSIFDTENEFSSCMSGPEPVKQCRMSPSYMECSSRAGGKTDTNLFIHFQDSSLCLMSINA